MIPPQMQQQRPALPHLPGADSGEVETHLGIAETIETHLREKHLSTPEDCPTCLKPSNTVLPLCWTQSINVLLWAILHSKQYGLNTSSSFHHYLCGILGMVNRRTQWVGLPIVIVIGPRKLKH